jgi:hypothetical protein
MINVHKEYKQAFLLEPTKLGRLVDKIQSAWPLEIAASKLDAPTDRLLAMLAPGR